MNQRIPNPDCRDGKHGNCDGHGWDIDADTAVRCPCDCHSKEVSIHRHGPLVLDHSRGWQCDTCGDWLPLDYRGPDVGQRIQPGDTLGHSGDTHAVPLTQGGMPDHMHHQELPHKWADTSDTYCI